MTNTTEPVREVGTAGNMPGSNGGFTTAVFTAEHVPAGAKLYAAQQPEAPAQSNDMTDCRVPHSKFDPCHNCDPQPAIPEGVEQTLRDALAYVGYRSDGDLKTLAERCELWMRESRVLIDMQKDLIAAALCGWRP